MNNYDYLNNVIEQAESEDALTIIEWQEYISEGAIYNIDLFTDADWTILFKELPNKSVIWKKRFAECLGNPEDENQFKALIYLTKEEDLELFSIVLTQLLYYDVTTIDNYDEICAKIEKKLPLVSYGYQCNFNEFLERKNKSI